VSVRGLHKSFGEHSVLSGVELAIPAGTITSVLGPSGCGKTTLLRIVAGFDEPDGGVVSICGHAVAGQGHSVPAHRRRVGLMPQEGALFPHLSVGRNVGFGLTGSARDTSKEVAYWLEVVGLAGLADSRPHELSGGQQQRVALARALAPRPRVLLLDEPFASLDAGLRVRVREDIAEILRAADTTALLVTHDQSEALSLADSVALLLGGRITQHGRPAELYARPADLASARFIGATVELRGDCHDGVVTTALGRHRARVPVADGPVVVVLRPEELRLHDAADGDVNARVTGFRFYGADAVVHVAMSDGVALRLGSPGDVQVENGAPVAVEVVGDVLAYASPTGG
jgi:iron(III) transport system ATP-binding protein